MSSLTSRMSRHASLVVAHCRRLRPCRRSGRSSTGTSLYARPLWVFQEHIVAKVQACGRRQVNLALVAEKYNQGPMRGDSAGRSAQRLDNESRKPQIRNSVAGAELHA